MGVAGKHGISKDTPKNIPLGAGTIHRGLTHTQGTGWNFNESIIGATAGGNKVTIKGEIFDIELDGALVKVKGLAVKNGGTATMENNFAELSREILKMSTLFEDGVSEDEAYTMLQDKAHIEDGDYVENYAFVGQTANGAKKIIVIFENGLCTSGFDYEGKNKENGVIKVTMEAYAENGGDLDTIPVKIYYPDGVIA